MPVHRLVWFWIVAALGALTSGPAGGAANPVQPGQVYLVIGSDTAIWNDGSTVDVYDPRPYYTLDFFTDPGSPAFQVMDPAWRSQFKDSFGQVIKFTWWVMGGNIYRAASNLNVPVPNTLVLHAFQQYHGAALRQFGDELSLHYHTFIWSDYNGDGTFFWNQSRTFAECREDFDVTLAQYLLEEEVFPASFRSGWHYMDNDWQAYLNQLLPYNLDNNWPAYVPWPTNEPVFNVQDWSRATGAFVPFHPATNDYQVAGTGAGWNVRSIKMQAMTARDMDAIFALAADGTDQVACIWDHLPENFVANFTRIDSLAQTAAAAHPTARFRYCTAVEAMQRWRGTTDTNPPTIDISEATQGQTVTLTLHTDEPLFQPQPFVALRDVFQQYTNLSTHCVPAGTNTWALVLPTPRRWVAKIGIAATDLAGNVATRLVRYLPDDLYIDNLDPGYTEPSGSWTSTTNASWGTDARLAPLDTHSLVQARWLLPVARSGYYNVAVQVPSITNAAGHVRFNLASGNSNSLSVLFPKPLPSGQWIVLGASILDATETNALEMTVSGQDQPGTWAVADVVRVVPLPDPDPASPGAPLFDQLTIRRTDAGFLLEFSGQPGTSCAVQRSAEPSAGWTTLATVPVPGSGLLEYEDSHPLTTTAFYRIASNAAQ
jgi:hypothetical protein